MSKIQKKYDKAVEAALLELFTEVEKVFKKKSYSRFVMAMGAFFFVDKNDNILNTDKKSMKKVSALIYEWDQYLYLTGNAIMIDRNLKKCYEWAPKPIDWFEDSKEDAVKRLLNQEIK